MTDQTKEQTVAQAETTRDSFIQRALSILNAYGAQYKIILKDGQEFGTLEVAKQKPEKPLPHRRPLKYGALGTITKHIKQHIGDQEDTLRTIPYSIFKPQDLQTSTALWCRDNWGKEHYMTQRKDDGIEVLKIKAV